MDGATRSNKVKNGASLWRRITVFIVFLVCVNLLAGFVAIKLGYPSLYNVKASFGEYAVPLPFMWAFAHIPSMLIYGLPLLFLPAWQEKYVRYYRIVCICSFILLLLELDGKSPFLLFPKVDAVVALIFSLIVVPPTRRDNPILVKVLLLSTFVGALFLAYYLYSWWIHRTPDIKNTNYDAGVFELLTIQVNNDFRKEMLFKVQLIETLPEEQLCEHAQTLASELLRDYPFDNDYKKEIHMVFTPLGEDEARSYNLGEVSLENKHKDRDGRFACYMKYRDPKTLYW